MPFVSVGKVRIRYEVAGAPGAPAVLLLNSLGTDLAMWDGQMAELLHSYRVIRYDMRGHGRSSSPEGLECTIATLAGDALAVLGAEKVTAAHWCGLSLGGMVAMWAAAHYPERVARLLLCNTTAYLPPASVWQSRMDLVLREGMSAIANVIPGRWFSESFRANSPVQVERIRQMLLGTDLRGYAAACGAIRDMDQRADLGRIVAPTLIVGGASDPATPLAHSEDLQAGITGSKLRVLEAAHLSNVERPQEFSAVVGEFLASGLTQ